MSVEAPSVSIAPRIGGFESPRSSGAFSISRGSELRTSKPFASAPKHRAINLHRPSRNLLRSTGIKEAPQVFSRRIHQKPHSLDRPPIGSSSGSPHRVFPEGVKPWGRVGPPRSLSNHSNASERFSKSSALKSTKSSETKSQKIFNTHEFKVPRTQALEKISNIEKAPSLNRVVLSEGLLKARAERRTSLKEQKSPDLLKLPTYRPSQQSILSARLSDKPSQEFKPQEWKTIISTPKTEVTKTKTANPIEPIIAPGLIQARREALLSKNKNHKTESAPQIVLQEFK